MILFLEAHLPIIKKPTKLYRNITVEYSAVLCVIME